MNSQGQLQNSVNNNNSNNNSNGPVYLLGVDGQGVGDDLDIMVFVNAESKEFRGPIKYGDTICIKCPASKERY